MTQFDHPENKAFPFLAGGGEMGQLMRSICWSSTVLGNPEKWPLALKLNTDLILSSQFPMLICWGTDYIQLYNDAFRPILGATKHPRAMGVSASETYAEIWETIGPMFECVMKGEAVGFPDFMVQLNRNGYTEDCYFDFSYNPIRDEKGNIGGIMVVCVETTEKVRAIAEFKDLNEKLALLNENYITINEELTVVNEELAATNEELTETQKNLQQVNSELSENESRLNIALKAVTRSERFFRSIAINIPNSVVIVIDKEHRYIIVEGDLMDKMGYDRRDYEGKHPTEIGQTERYEASKHLYDKMMAGEQFSVERKAATGEYYLVHLVPLRNEHGEVDAGLVMAFDITSIKQDEEKSAKLAAIIESSDDAIISKTLESVITSWNDSAQRMFGYTADEIIGETIYKLIPPDRQDEEPRILSRLKSGERVEHFETKRMTKHGSLLDVSLTISPIKDRQGKIIGLSKIARDITDRKLDEIRKNDFIGMVSHELKTPLTSLTAMVQLLKAKLKNSEDPIVPNLLEKANVQVKKMTTMINGFLNISRLESGKIRIDKQKLNLEDLVAEIIEETELTVSSHIIKFEPGGPVIVNADPDKIYSVITNLIGNAVKYSPKGTVVEVKCEVIGQNAQVSIKDEGIGIKPQDIGNLFERYYRVENSSTQHISGFGIGLYLSAEIIGRHDGKIWVESKNDVGSVFYFSLPLN
jgi:PAS domain S-box-containing protein